MNVIVNGSARAVDEGATVEDLVRRVAGDRTRSLAVAVNGEVVRRDRWPETPLDEQDRVEILGAMQGG